MGFQELIRKRHSVRAYKSESIPQDVLEKVIEAGRLAPTAANRQGFKIFVIKTDDFKDELKKIYPQEWFFNAPYVIGICSIPKETWVRRDGKNYADVDAAIVMDHIILAATDSGLGTCWIGAFNVEAARDFLEIPADMEPIAFTPIGYPADKLRAKIRKPIDKIVHYIY